MRRKRPANGPVPRKYKYFHPGEWEESGLSWVTERERWNAAQPADPRTGHGPLGGPVKLLRDRREARMKWLAWQQEIHSNR